MTFTPSGAEKMSNWSRAHVNEHAQMAAVLDGRVLSIAGLTDNEILTDNAQITGTFTPEWVESFCAQVNAGSMSSDLELVSAQQISSNAR